MELWPRSTAIAIGHIVHCQRHQIQYQDDGIHADHLSLCQDQDPEWIQVISGMTRQSNRQLSKRSCPATQFSRVPARGSVFTLDRSQCIVHGTSFRTERTPDALLHASECIAAVQVRPTPHACKQPAADGLGIRGVCDIPP